MTTANHAIGEEELHAFVDGELDPKRTAQIEALLVEELGTAEAVQSIRAQKARLHLAFDGVLDEPVPAFLASAKPARPRLLRMAAVVAWIGLGIVIGWGIRDVRVEPQHIVLPRQAAIAHVAFTPEVRHPVEVSAAEEVHLVAWLSKRLGAKVRAPKLGELGYELLGGRLLPEAGRPGAQFMYQDATGKRLTLYVSTDVDNRDTAFRYATEGRVHVFYWIDQHLGYALSGEIEKAEMLRIARRVYEQLNP